MLRRFTFYEAHMASFTTETTKFWWSLFVRTSFGGTSHYTNICPAVELRSWWKSYFWAKKIATITSDRMFSRDLTLEKLQQKGAATLIGSISSCQLNHSSWWLKSCDHQLRLVGNIPLFTGFYTSQVVIARFLNHQQIYSRDRNPICHPSDCHRWLYWNDLHRGTLPCCSAGWLKDMRP